MSAFYELYENLQITYSFFIFRYFYIISAICHIIIFCPIFSSIVWPMTLSPELPECLNC